MNQTWTSYRFNAAEIVKKLYEPTPRGKCENNKWWIMKGVLVAQVREIQQRLLKYKAHFVATNFKSMIQANPSQVLIFANLLTALHFMATSAQPAARQIRILIMNEYACWLITFGMTQLQFTDHTRC
jgi:hypothetical protein